MVRFIEKCVSQEALQERLLRAIQQSVNRSQRPIFAIGLSGGSLPALLTTVLPKVVTDWSKWRFFFCDERLVPFADPESTFGVYKRGLLTQFPLISENQFITIDESLPAEETAADYERRMRTILGDRGLDLALLGMGPDGHTCSLFPERNLDSDNWVTLVTNSPKPPPTRITMTLKFLEICDFGVFVAFGESKAKVIQQMFVENKTFPAIRVNCSSILWLLDTESASLLPDNLLTESKEEVLDSINE